MRRGLVGAVPLVLLLAGQPAGATHVGQLGCGDLAPFSNECVDPEGLTYGGHDLFGWAFLGFTGRIDSTLEQRIPWLGLTVRKTVSCEFLMLEVPGLSVPTCTGPTMSPSWWPSLIPGLPVSLRCRAWPMGLAGPVSAGPWGPWGCSVAL